jgi:hypothetical protein
VYELIRTWELSFLEKQKMNQAVESMQMQALIEPRASESDLEPMRFVSVSEPPPKRFYRTFWRSVTRRILQREKGSALDGVAMSS